MADPSESSPAPPAARPPMPRWVKVVVIVAALVAVLVVLMLAGVLGTGHGPGRHLGGPHGAAAGIGESGPASPATRTIEVTAKDTAFDPVSLQVAAGETVTFSIKNEGRVVHEFTLGDERMQREHAQMMEHSPVGMGHDTPNSVTIAPGETKRLTWRFADAATVAFACHQPGHYEAGMRGRITVA